MRLRPLDSFDADYIFEWFLKEIKSRVDYESPISGSKVMNTGLNVGSDVFLRRGVFQIKSARTCLYSVALCNPEFPIKELASETMFVYKFTPFTRKCDINLSICGNKLRKILFQYFSYDPSYSDSQVTICGEIKLNTESKYNDMIATLPSDPSSGSQTHSFVPRLFCGYSLDRDLVFLYKDGAFICKL